MAVFFVLITVGLCWWPFLIVALSETAHLFNAITFIGLKFPHDFDPISSSSIVYSGLLNIVNSFALTANILRVTLEALMQCFSMSVNLIFPNSTLNSKQHLFFFLSSISRARCICQREKGKPKSSLLEFSFLTGISIKSKQNKRWNYQFYFLCIHFTRHSL